MTQDTNATGGPGIKRYKIGYHTDEWGVRSSTPGGITDPSGQWVLYKDHLAALASHGQAPAQAAQLPLLARDIAADFGVAPVQVCLALVELGFGHRSVNMAITPEMAEKLREHFAHTAQQPPAQAAPAAE